MKGFVLKSTLVLCGLILTIAVIGQVFPQSQSVGTVPMVTEKVLVPGGQSVGVKMDVRGVLVVGLEEITDNNGNKVNPGLLSGLQIGDMIIEIDGTEVFGLCTPRIGKDHSYPQSFGICPSGICISDGGTGGHGLPAEEDQ